jgi:hypothetical protein
MLFCGKIYTNKGGKFRSGRIIVFSRIIYNKKEEGCKIATFVLFLFLDYSSEKSPQQVQLSPQPQVILT